MILPLRQAILILALVLAGCGQRHAEAKSDSVRQAGIANADALRAGLFHACGTVISGQRISAFTVTQTGPQEWAGHVVPEHPQAPYSSGIACALAPGDRYLTAAHCVDRQPLTVLRIDGRMQPHVLPATVIWSDPERDVALISAPGCADEPVLTLAEATPGVGDVVAILGNWDELSAGTVLDADAARSLLLCSAPTRIGDSGGPVIDRHGRLAGVVSRGRTSGWFTTTHRTVVGTVTAIELAPAGQQVPRQEGK